MSTAEDVTTEKARSIKVQVSGGGGGDEPPDIDEQSEAEVVGSSTSTVFVAGGSGFVGSEICSQVSFWLPASKNLSLPSTQKVIAKSNLSERTADRGEVAPI